jgi:hypothetical protein
MVCTLVDGHVVCGPRAVLIVDAAVFNQTGPRAVLFVDAAVFNRNGFRYHRTVNKCSEAIRYLMVIFNQILVVSAQIDV